MRMKFHAPFLKFLLCQRISTVYPSMSFVSRTSTSSSAGDINSGMKLRSRSEENLTKLDECMENMDDDVSKLFMKYHQTDLCDDPELFLLLNNYFITSKEVSELCESLRNCLDRAKHSELLLIDEALHAFEEEKSGYGGILEASFRKTFQNLKNFDEFYNNSGDGDFDCDFLGGDFIRKFQICHEDLAKMILKLEKTMKQIDKKLKRVRGRRAIVAAALLAPLIAVLFVSKMVVGIFGLVPLEPLTTFIASRWKKSTESLKREKTAMTSMERGTMVALKEIEKISKLVSRLETVERSLRVTAEFAVKKRSSVAVTMRVMEKEKKRLKSTLVDLDRETGRCDGFAQFGRTVALEKIAEFLSRGEKSSK